MSKLTDEEKNTKLLGLIRDRYSRSAQKSYDVFREIEECRSYYRGDQWPVPSGVSIDEEDWRVRITVNKLPAAVDSIISVFLGQSPIIVTTPPTDETEDRDAAKVSEDLLYYYWDEKDIQTIKLNELCKHFLIDGVAFMRPRWDSFSGDEIPYEDEETGESELVNEGDIEVDVIDPLSVSVEPGASDVDDAAWLIVTELVLKDDIEQRFKVDPSEDEEVEDESSSDHDLSDSGVIPKSLDDLNETPERIPFQTMYERPTRKNPKGRVVYATTRNILRVDDKLPCKVQNKYVIPVVKFDGIPLIGEFWPTSVVSQSVPLQDAYNRLRSQIIENRNIMSRPQWVAPDGSIDDDVITDEPGSIVFYDHISSGGIPPQQAQVYRTDSAHLNELGLIINDLDDITSRHDVSMGRQSSNITSGKHADELRSADDSRHSPGLKLFEKKLARFARYFLSILKENVKNERVLKIIGESKTYEMKRFSGADISDRANIKFEITSQMPWNADAMRQTAIWMYSQKLIDDSQLKERLNWPTRRSLYEPEQNHFINARNENGSLEVTYNKPFTTDNHEIHEKVHRSLLNDPAMRQRFEQERAMVEQAKQMQAPPPQNLLYFNILKHLEEHRKMRQPAPPPPPDKKVAVNVSSKDIDPKLSEQVVAETIGKDAPAQQEDQASPGLDKPMGSMPGGMSGEMYTSPGG